MKNKGRLYKRAVDALKKDHLDRRYTKGYVVSVLKSQPNYFNAILWDSWSEEWIKMYCGFISAYVS